MKYLKIALSLLALLAGAAGAVLASGSPVQVNPATISLVMAIASGISFLGFSPYALSDTLAKSLSAASLIITAFIGWHAATVTAAVNPHPFIWAGIAFVGAIVGVLGKSPLPGAKSAAAKLDAPPPAAK